MDRAPCDSGQAVGGIADELASASDLHDLRAGASALLEVITLEVLRKRFGR